MEEFAVGETVRINTPGESHHKRTGTVVRTVLGDSFGRILVDLGDVQWLYFPEELMKDRYKGL